MTLNDHFALKYVSGSVFNGLAFWLSEKTVRKFAELYNVGGKKCSPWTVLVIQMSWRYSLGIPEEETSNH